MSSLPTPLRAALGLAAVTLENARSLPAKAIEVPVSAVSQVLQLSLRAQQRYAELTIRGDELLGQLRGIPEEPPDWATFDEPPSPNGQPDVASDPLDLDGAHSSSTPAASARRHAPRRTAGTDPPAGPSGARRRSGTNRAPAKRTPAKRAPAKRSATQSNAAQGEPAAEAPPEG